MAEAKRRLAAILSADVAGYSRLMGADEEGTVAALDACRAIFKRAIESHDGQVVDTAGDSVLAIFDSVVEAVRCSVKVQKALAERDSDLAEDRRMQFRIGVNLGDVIAKGDGTIYGDGVNVAARLESLAQPGGICLSGSAHEQVEGKTDLSFQDVGEYSVKNILRPIRTYQIRANPTAATLPSGKPLAIPDYPSIAVLPFTNMSSDRDQDYFADGITEDIITGLARSGMFSVVARNSTFNYKESNTKARQTAEDLGAHYIVEGSVRRSSSMVRISAQLIDAVNDKHIWAEHYDRELEDFIAVQDEIAARIVRAIAPEYMAAEKQRVAHKADHHLGAWDHFVKAYWSFQRFTKESLAEAAKECESAIERDPHGSSQHGLLAVVYTLQAFYGWCESYDATRLLARTHGERAVALDSRNPISHRGLGHVELYDRCIPQAIYHFKTAVELDPFEGENMALLGNSHGANGDYDKALACYEQAFEMSPHDAFLAPWYSNLAMCAVAIGRVEEGESWARRSIQENPNFPGGYRSLASALGQQGRLEEARAPLAKLKEIIPDVNLETLKRVLVLVKSEHVERYLEGLQKAGLD